MVGDNIEASRRTSPRTGKEVPATVVLRTNGVKPGQLKAWIAKDDSDFTASGNTGKALKREAPGAESDDPDYASPRGANNALDSTILSANATVSRRNNPLANREIST